MSLDQSSKRNTHGPGSLESHSSATDVNAAPSTRRASGLERLKSLSQRAGRPVSGTPLPSQAWPDDRVPTSTAGFESPEKQSIVAQTTKDEVKQYMQKCRDQKKGSTGGGDRLEVVGCHTAFKKQDTRPRSDQGQHSSRAAGPKAAGVEDDTQLDMLTRDVAARIIQIHWRKMQAWKQQLRQAGEARIIQQLLSSSSDPGAHQGASRHLYSCMPLHLEQQPQLSCSQLPAITAAASKVQAVPSKRLQSDSAHLPSVPSSAWPPHAPQQHHQDGPGGPQAPTQAASCGHSTRAPRSQAPLHPDTASSAAAASRRHSTTGTTASFGAPTSQGSGKLRRNSHTGGPPAAATSRPAAPRPKSCTSAASAAADGITRTLSIPGGHAVYSVSASTSRRVSWVGSASDITQSDLALCAPDASPPVAAGTGASPAAQPTGGADQGLPGLRDDDTTSPGVTTAADGLQGQGQRGVCDESENENEVEESDVSRARTGASHDGVEQEPEEEEEEGRASHVHGLLCKLVAGQVPDCMEEEDMQLLVSALQQTQYCQRAATNSSTAGGEGRTPGTGAEPDSEPVVVRAGAGLEQGCGDGGCGAQQAGHAQPQHRATLDYELAANDTKGQGHRVARPGVSPASGAAVPGAGATAAVSGAVEAGGGGGGGSAARLGSQHHGVCGSQSRSLAGCSVLPVGASGEEEDLEAVHELRASQALPEGHVMLSRPCLQHPQQQWQPGGDALRSSLTSVVRAGGESLMRSSRADLGPLTRGLVPRPVSGRHASARYSSSSSSILQQHSSLVAAAQQPQQQQQHSRTEAVGSQQQQEERHSLYIGSEQQQQQQPQPPQQLQQQSQQQQHSSQAEAGRQQTQGDDPDGTSTPHRQWPNAVGDPMALAWPPHSRVEEPCPAVPSHDPAALSLTSEKLSSILAYLDDVEQRSLLQDCSPGPPGPPTASPLQPLIQNLQAPSHIGEAGQGAGPPSPWVNQQQQGQGQGSSMWVNQQQQQQQGLQGSSMVLGARLTLQASRRISQGGHAGHRHSQDAAASCVVEVLQQQQEGGTPHSLAGADQDWPRQQRQLQQQQLRQSQSFRQPPPSPPWSGPTDSAGATSEPSRRAVLPQPPPHLPLRSAGSDSLLQRDGSILSLASIRTSAGPGPLSTRAAGPPSVSLASMPPRRDTPAGIRPSGGLAAGGYTGQPPSTAPGQHGPAAGPGWAADPCLPGRLEASGSLASLHSSASLAHMGAHASMSGSMQGAVQGAGVARPLAGGEAGAVSAMPSTRALSPGRGAAGGEPCSAPAQLLPHCLAFLDQQVDSQAPATATWAAAGAGGEAGCASARQQTSSLSGLLADLCMGPAGGGGGVVGGGGSWRGRSQSSTGVGGQLGGAAAAAGEVLGAQKPAHLAASVYDGVKSKIRQLQQDVKDREAALAMLHKELDAAHQRASLLLADAENRGAEALAQARHEHEAALARHLSFMDRLLADKDDLNRKCAAMAESLKASEARQERNLAALKDGWAAELKRQKEAWAAGERVKREAWMEAKTSEVKELTVKGLEQEVQKLLAKHKNELTAVQAAAKEDSRKQLDAAAAQQEMALRQLKERMLKEQEEAVERERAAGATRLREMSERYEQQAAMQRMRLVSEGDLRLEQLEAVRREERKRHEEGLAKAAQEAEERVKAVQEEGRKEREALRRAHEKQINALREGQDAEQEGWRAAVTERARREVAEREAALCDRMARERDEQIELVVQRLEAEAGAAREAAREEASRREAAVTARHSSALQDAKKAEAKLQEQFRLAVQAQATAEAQAAAAEAQADAARRESEARASTIRWLESQVASAQEQVSGAIREARKASSTREAQAEAVQAAQEATREKEALQARLEAVVRELRELKSSHAREMEHVEARVRAALARKDESLASAQQQIAALSAQLRNTEAVLAQQQAELHAL